MTAETLTWPPSKIPFCFPSVSIPPFPSAFGPSFKTSSIKIPKRRGEPQKKEKKEKSPSERLIQWQNASSDRAKIALDQDLPSLILRMTRVLEEGEALVSFDTMDAETVGEGEEDAGCRKRLRSSSVFLEEVSRNKRKRGLGEEEGPRSRAEKEQDAVVCKEEAIERIRRMWDDTRETFGEALHLLGILDHWVQMCRAAAGRGAHFQDSVQESLGRELIGVRKSIEEHLEREPKYALDVSAVSNSEALLASIVSHQWTWLWVSWSNVRNMCSIIYDLMTKNRDHLRTDSMRNSSY